MLGAGTELHSFQCPPGTNPGPARSCASPAQPGCALSAARCCQLPDWGCMKAQRGVVTCSEFPDEKGPREGSEPSPESFLLIATPKAAFLIAKPSAGSLVSHAPEGQGCIFEQKIGQTRYQGGHLGSNPSTVIPGWVVLGKWLILSIHTSISSSIK